jgi:hypothetical protein
VREDLIVSDETKRFLVCLDYGTGGIWRTVTAPRATLISALYPELDIIDPDDLPKWMSRDKYLEYLNNDSTPEEDVDSPGRFLQSFTETRIRDLQREGRERQVFTVGFDDGERTWWGWVQAHTEPELRALYPEVLVRHGRDDDWLAATRANGSFDETVSDIAEPAAGVLGRVWAERRSSRSA